MYTAKEIAKLLHGTVEGDENVVITKPCKIEEVEKGGITFLANPKYTHYIYERQASAIVVSNTFVPEQPIDATLIRVENPYHCVVKLLRLFSGKKRTLRGRSLRAHVGRHTHLGKDCYVGAGAYVGEHVSLGKNVKIYPQVYVGDYVTIGDDCILYPGVKVYHHCAIGNRCTFHAGTIIGADGFGFAPNAEGHYDKIDQIGNVVIEDDVEVGANTCIDRATMGSTIIHRGVKIDNLCQIAHNVVVGEDTVMAAQSAIAGSGKVGSHCVIAGQVGIVGHIVVGDYVTVAAQSGVTHNIKDHSVLLGTPAIDGSKQKRNYVYTRNMEALVARIDALEKQLKETKKED